MWLQNTPTLNLFEHGRTLPVRMFEYLKQTQEKQTNRTNVNAISQLYTKSFSQLTASDVRQLYEYIKENYTPFSQQYNEQISDNSLPDTWENFEQKKLWWKSWCQQTITQARDTLKITLNKIVSNKEDNIDMLIWNYSFMKDYRHILNEMKNLENMEEAIEVMENRWKMKRVMNKMKNTRKIFEVIDEMEYPVYMWIAIDENHIKMPRDEEILVDIARSIDLFIESSNIMPNYFL